MGFWLEMADRLENELFQVVVSIDGSCMDFPEKQNFADYTFIDICGLIPSLQQSTR